MSTMHKKAIPEHKHRQFIQNGRVASPVLDGLTSFDEILDLSYAYLRPLGLFKLTERPTCKQLSPVRQRLDQLIDQAWVKKNRAEIRHKKYSNTVVSIISI